MHNFSVVTVFAHVYHCLTLSDRLIILSTRARLPIAYVALCLDVDEIMLSVL